MMNLEGFRKYLVLLLLVLTSGALCAQLQIAHLLETQYGKLPREIADPFPSIYDRAEISYRQKAWRAEATIEQYRTTFDDRGYLDFSQFRLGYKKKKWDIKVGNVYETLGKGVLLRSFEFPGALLEDQGFRSRNYFHRDILGASVKYRTKKFTLHALHGDVLNNTLPPIFERSDRRTDLITAFSSNFKYVKGHQAEIIGMRLSDGSGVGSVPDRYYISAGASGKITKGLNYFGEYAVGVNSGNDSRAIYAGLSGFTGNFSFSVEYKDYNDFFLGVGINEPPAAIKQQTYRTLNRSIHVSDPQEESGYQIELFYNFDSGTILNLNHSLATNPFGSTTTTFRQYFFEIQSFLSESFDFKAFVDYSVDPFKREENRFTIGVYTDFAISKDLRLLPEIEYQTFDRNGSSVYNWSPLLGLKIKSKLFVSVLGDLSSDPFLRDPERNSKLYLGGTVRYTPSYLHTFQAFVGTRRGGPQCTAGVCYEILDFQGVEVRWVGRWKVKTSRKNKKKRKGGF